jgi:hypothetical protein
MSRRSQGSKWTVAPRLFNSSVKAPPRASSMSMKPAWEPWSAKARTICSPMPEAPPVTKTTVSFKLG